MQSEARAELSKRERAEQTARPIVQQVVARRRIGQARNEVIDSERELRRLRSRRTLSSRRLWCVRDMRL